MADETPLWPKAILEGMTEDQKAVLEPPYATRLDRPLLSPLSDDPDSPVEIETLSRVPEKKQFDRDVFGTKYF